MKAIMLAVLAGLCWGIGELFTKSVLHTKQIGPITAVTIRSTVALPVMWLVWLAFVKWKGLEPDRLLPTDAATTWKLVLGSGLVAGAGGMIFFYSALNWGEVSRVKPVAFALAPTIAVLGAWAFLGEAMTVRKAIAASMIIGGVILMTGGSKVAG